MSSPTKFVPYFNNHRHKIILDSAVAKAVRMLTGRKAFNAQDKEALSMLGIGLVHVNDIDLSGTKAIAPRRGRPPRA